LSFSNHVIVLHDVNNKNSYMAVSVVLENP